MCLQRGFENLNLFLIGYAQYVMAFWRIETVTPRHAETEVARTEMARPLQTKSIDTAFHAANAIDVALKNARTVLIVDAPEALSLLQEKPGLQSVVMTQKRMLSSDMIATVNPSAIIGPLITDEWDIVDLGILLETMGYTGDLYAMTRPLPRAELVVREVGAICRGLKVRLLETG